MIEDINWLQRRRLAAVAEIKTAARQQIAEKGAQHLSLGGIARSLGMTTPALYRYFENRDALIAALVIDTYDSMGRAMEQALDGIPDDNHPGRFLALMQAYRGWAVNNPEDYALMYGLPTAEVDMTTEQSQNFQTVTLRSMRAMVQVLQSAYEAGKLNIPKPYRIPPSTFKNSLQWMQACLKDTSIPLGILALALTTWIRADGLIWQELHGHLPQRFFGDGEFYEMECQFLMEGLGLL